MNLKQLNILLADDDPDDCSFFKEALEGLNIAATLTIVNDGEELMELLNNEEGEDNYAPLPDVIFLDINMPRKNGYECLAEIKKNKKLQDLPVVIFSTSNAQDKISLLFKIGAQVYIHKPRDFEQLKQVINHALPMAVEKVASKSQLKYILNA
jgi:CheY-like chemotaxis protein